MKNITTLLLPVLLAACAPNPATGKLDFNLASRAEQRDTGMANAEAELRVHGLYRPASAATMYINALCNKIYAATEVPAEAVQCNVLDTAEYNAWASPGYLSVNRGILPFLESEDELAAVLGHESGHLTARHTARSITQGHIANAIVSGFAIAAAENNAPLSDVTGLIDASHTAKELTHAAFSRSHEEEADALGQRYMAKAGYDPAAMVSMNRGAMLYEAFRNQQVTAFNNGKIAPVSLLDKLKTSHPATPERLAAALARSGEPSPSARIEENRTRYLTAINGLAYGPARRYGIARRNELVLPRQRVVIPLPEGTTTAYVGSGDHDALGTWLIAHPQSGAYVEVTAVQVTAGHNPASMLSKLVPALLRDDVQRINIGLPPQEEDTAATAADPTSDEADEDTFDHDYTTAQSIGYTTTYRFLGSNLRYRAVAVSGPATVNQMLLFTIVYPDAETLAREDGNLMAVLKNIRYLTKRQAKKYKPLEVRTFTATVSDTLAARAVALPTGSLNEHLFRALNNLAPPQQLTPNRLYKTIVDPNP